MIAEDRIDYLTARAIMTEYVQRYAAESFDVVTLEATFRVPLVNPDSKRAAIKVIKRGKVDGVVSRSTTHAAVLASTKALFLLEHKTASSVGGDYLDKLWTDLQVHEYVAAVEAELGEPLAGVIYNVLVKPRLEPRAGKPGKVKVDGTPGKSTPPETEEEFVLRLAERMAEPEMLQRHELMIDRAQMVSVARDTWAIHDELLRAHRAADKAGCTGLASPAVERAFRRNTSNCHKYGAPCSYYRICKSANDPFVIANFYERRDANGHVELDGASPTLRDVRRRLDLERGVACAAPVVDEAGELAQAAVPVLPLAPSPPPIELTQSAINAWRGCPRLYFLRYVERLQSTTRAHALGFGDRIHQALELWHATRDAAAVEAKLEALFAATPAMPAGQSGASTGQTTAGAGLSDFAEFFAAVADSVPVTPSESSPF